MATLTVKDLPTELHRRLKARAERNGRSLNREVIECLEASVRPERVDVLDLVSRSPCTAYDCEFVAVAKGMGIPLVTEDRQVLAAFPGIAVSQRAFVGH
jgi:plasmid stability protein